jgi:hypothetical protein
MPTLISRRRIFFFATILSTALAVGWLVWNRATRVDMSIWAPADSLAFVELNDLTTLIDGTQHTDAWKALANPIGAPATLSVDRWWLRLARWTGIGSADAILFSRSQVAIVFNGAEGEQTGSTLTVKPLTIFVVETHTSQRRMRATVERHIEELAKRVYPAPVFIRKQIDGVDLSEWSSADGSRRIVFTFVDTAVVVGNDESSVLHSIEAHSGRRGSLQSSSELSVTRQTLDSANTPIFGFVSQPGVRSFLQAFALYRSGSSADALTGARIFADTVGGVVKNLGWTARFRDGIVEDRCFVSLVEGVSEKLKTSVIPDRGPNLTNLTFVPQSSFSLSLYQFHDSASFWTDLNATISSHTDLVGSIATRPMLQALVKPYGIDDADTFSRAIGPKLQTIRFEETSPAVLVAEAFDRPSVLKVISLRFGPKPATEKIDDVELLLAQKDNWAATFVDNYFLIGPAEGIRRCLQSRSQKQSITASESFRKAQQLVDISLPIFATSFTNDQQRAISFVEVFAENERSAFSTNADAVAHAAQSLPYAVSVSVLKPSGVEWSSRSSFGLGGLLVVQLFPRGGR